MATYNEHDDAAYLFSVSEDFPKSGSSRFLAVDLGCNTGCGCGREPRVVVVGDSEEQAADRCSYHQGLANVEKHAVMILRVTRVEV